MFLPVSYTHLDVYKRQCLGYVCVFDGYYADTVEIDQFRAADF